MMTRFSKCFLALTVALLVVWKVPGLYNFVAAGADKSPFTLYSSVLHEFVQIATGEEGTVRSTADGRKTFTQKEFDAVLPLFYARQLVADGCFPDSVAGRPMTPQQAVHHSFNVRISPSDVNAPQVGLYPLLESHSGRVQLEMPSDVFRMTRRGMEFVDMATNAPDTAKSGRFTRTLAAKGFRFPARVLSGDPNARKEYDEGYLVVDAAGGLFHLKMVVGRPFVRPIALPEGVEIVRPFITEFRDRSCLGLLSARDGALYALRMPGYRVERVGVPGWNPEREQIVIFGNPIDWTIRIASRDTERYYAVSADDLRPIDSLVRRDDSFTLPGLHFTSPLDRYVRPRFGR